MSDNLKLDDIEKLLAMLSENDVSEFRLEREDEKLWLRRGKQVEYVQQQFVAAPVSATTPAAAATASAEAAPAVVAVAAKKYHEVKSPMVGTFYRRPAPDTEPYATVGDRVKKGDVLCIIEAMKLMNEIEADTSGVVVEVCLDDAQMVEYGEVLYRIDPSA